MAKDDKQTNSTCVCNDYKGDEPYTCLRCEGEREERKPRRRKEKPLPARCPYHSGTNKPCDARCDYDVFATRI